MTIVFSEQADEDLQASLSYIHERNPGAALKVARKVFAGLSVLGSGTVLRIYHHARRPL